MSLLVGLVMLATAQAPVETSVTFTGAGGLKIFGTLVIPNHSSGHQVPGVLLLPGSGPVDRNGNVAPSVMTNLLKDISGSLVENGFATLRFDKRATRMYLTNFPKEKAKLAEFFSWENFVGDATNGLKFLQSQSAVDSSRTAIIGHSEGAELALQIGSNLAKSISKPAALITLGGTGRPIGPILTEQITRALDKQKVLPPVRKQYLEALEKCIEQVTKDSTFPADVPPGLTALFNETTTKLMHSYCVIDPAQLAKNYPGPVLVINGGHDTQVSPDRDAPKLKAALESRQSGSVEMLIVPDASHNLKSTMTGNDDAFNGPVAPLAMSKIKEFLIGHLHP